VREFGERVDLVHELRKLGRAEEFLDRCDYRLNGDEILGTDSVSLLKAHALFGDAFHPAEALFITFARTRHGSHAAIAEVVDVIDVRSAVVHVMRYFIVAMTSERTRVCSFTGTV